MKLHAILLMLLAIAAAGCSTINNRIQRNQAVFDRLDSTQQEKIRQGVIDIGFTEAMVYMALGEPNQKRQTTTEAETTQIWIYNSYYTAYEGHAQVGYRRIAVYDPHLRTYRFYIEPSYAPVYSQQTEENIRVSFRDGKVVTIDQTK